MLLKGGESSTNVSRLFSDLPLPSTVTGAGAGPTWHGRSGVHTHMTNTWVLCRPAPLVASRVAP